MDLSVKCNVGPQRDAQRIHSALFSLFLDSDYVETRAHRGSGGINLNMILDQVPGQRALHMRSKISTLDN